MGRFHFSYSRKGKTQEITETEFTNLLAEVLGDTSMCGSIGITVANYDRAKRAIKNAKRSKTDIYVWSSDAFSLFLRKDRKAGGTGRRMRDSAYPDPMVKLRKQ